MNTYHNPAVSIILPVFNAEAYLSQCLESILAQTMPDFEVICVNDGSTDNSPAILEQYAKKDQRLHIITQVNGGSGCARNTGIDHACGDYIVFLDSDDFFEAEMLEKLLNKAKETDAQIVTCRYRKYDTNTGKYGKPAGIKRELWKDHPVFSRKDFPDSMINVMSVALWNNIYRADLIKKENLRFPLIRNTEDVYFLFMAAFLAERISWIEDVLVNYRVGRNDSLEARKSDHPLCFIESEEAIYDELNRRNLYEGSEKGYINSAVNHLFYALKMISDSSHARAIAEERLVYHFFPKTHLLDYPDEFYDHPSRIQYLRRINERITQAMKSDNWQYLSEMDDYKLKILNIEKSILEEKNRELIEKLHNIKQSKSYRIGNAVTWIPQKIKKAIGNK